MTLSKRSLTLTNLAPLMIPHLCQVLFQSIKKIIPTDRHPLAGTAESIAQLKASRN